jgi:hypothetical protein
MNDQTKPMSDGDAARKVAQFKRLLNVRRCQTGQRAAATQRKLEALYNELYNAGRESELKS